jgi:hypothetical protein
MCLACSTGATGASSWPTPGRRPGHARRASQRVRVSRVRQIEVRVFEKVQKAVKNRVAAIGTPVHQPMHELPGLSRWREKLPMDCRYGFVSATESREKRAVHRAPRSAIHARNFASPIGA